MGDADVERMNGGLFSVWGAAHAGRATNVCRIRHGCVGVYILRVEQR